MKINNKWENRNSIGICSQEDKLYEELTTMEHLEFFGKIKNLKGSEL